MLRNLQRPEVVSILGNVLLQLPVVLSDMVSKIVPQSISKSLGVLCLGGHPFSELLWAHYADSNKGVAIVFHEKHDFFQQTGHPAERLRKVQKVNYQEERPLIKNFLTTGYSDESIIKLERELFFTKSDTWAYEEEMRCIRPFTEASEVYTIEDGTIVHLFAFPPDAIQGVVFGSRCTEENRGRIYAVMEQINSEHNLNLVAMQMESHIRKYSLDLKPYKP